MGAAAAIAAFGGVLGILSKIMGGAAGGAAGIQAIAYAAAGAIIVAVAILAIAWIFNFLPDMGAIADNISNLIIVPINKIIDVLARLKNEIGIENLIPLAIGIGVISYSLILLAAATAGLAAGGVASALGNAVGSILDGISELFGGEKSEGPLDILERLVRNSKGITQVATALGNFSDAAAGILKVAPVVDIVNGILNPLSQMGSTAAINLGFFVKSINEIKANNIVKMADPASKIAKAIHWMGDSNISTIKAATNFIQVLNKSSFNKQAASLERIAKAYKSIAESTNRINQVSMKQTTDLVKALGFLSAKGGDGAVEKLGENLIKAIEELGNIFDKYLEGQDGGKGGGKGGDGGKAKTDPGIAKLATNISAVATAVDKLKKTMTDTGIKIKSDVGNKVWVQIK